MDLPAELRRENVTVEQFVSPHEQPPEYVLTTTVITGMYEEPIAARIAWWRTHRAWRRWQDAVIEWGAERGLDRRALMALGMLPERNWMPHPH